MGKDVGGVSKYPSVGRYFSDPYVGFFMERYQGSRTICNCGNAYQSHTGMAYVGGKIVHNYPICFGGCNNAQYITRKEIEKAIYKEFIEGKE